MKMLHTIRFSGMTLILVAMVLISYSQQKMHFHNEPKQDKDDPEVFNVTKNTEPSFAGAHTYCQLDYLNRNDLEATIKSNGELKMLSKEEIQSKIDALSAGGFITITIKRLTLQAAKLEHFTIVVQNKAGDELFRGNPKGRSIPSYSRSSPGHYINAGTLRIDEPLKEEVKVFVIDEIKGIRHEYLIKPL